MQVNVQAHRRLLTKITYEEPSVASTDRIEESLNHDHGIIQETQASSTACRCKKRNTQNLCEDEPATGSFADSRRKNEEEPGACKESE